jgi:pimeloyl-ACP methyl ester carboxylesterase
MPGTPGTIGVDVNGHEFNVVDAGTGPGVLLLHGVGTGAELWRAQVPALVEAGFRVVAPELRGLGDDPDPATLDARRVGSVLDDIRGVLRTLGVPRVHVAGHAAGAVVAWMFTITQAQRVDRLAAIAGAYPAGFTPRGLQAGHGEAHDVFPPVDRPVLAVWGTRDDVVREASVLGSSIHVSGPWRYAPVEGAGHAVPTDQPERLNALLLEFFAAQPRAPRPTTDVRKMVGRPMASGLSDRLRTTDPDPG